MIHHLKKRRSSSSPNKQTPLADSKIFAPLTSFYQNCRRLNTKLTNLKCQFKISSVNYVFIVLSKTWLYENISNSELDLVNYDIFRYDRCISNSNCSRGGAVLIGIRKKFSSCSIIVSQLNVEHICVRFNIN